MPKGYPISGVNKGWFNKGHRDSERKFRNCLVCQTKFQTYPTFIKAGQGRFCSVPCARKAITLGLVKHGWSAEGLRKLSNRMKGNKFALGNGGKKHWNWQGGPPKCVDCEKAVSSSSIRCVDCSTKNLTGLGSPHWKGNNITYRTLHHWVEKCLGKPSTCEHCGKQNLTRHAIHWANKSGKYKRILEDWVRLCVKCHKKYDKK